MTCPNIEIIIAITDKFQCTSFELIWAWISLPCLFQSVCSTALCVPACTACCYGQTDSGKVIKDIPWTGVCVCVCVSVHAYAQYVLRLSTQECCDKPPKTCLYLSCTITFCWVRNSQMLVIKGVTAQRLPPHAKVIMPDTKSTWCGEKVMKTCEVYNLVLVADFSLGDGSNQRVSVSFDDSPVLSLKMRHSTSLWSYIEVHEALASPFVVGRSSTTCPCMFYR